MRRSMSGVHTLHAALDARRSYHLAPPGAHSAYTVVRTRSVTTITTNTLSQRTVLCAGQWNDGAATPQVNCLPYHAVYGVGTNVPGTTESYISDPLLSGAGAGTYNLSLHAMTIVVTADGSATSGVGTFYMGTVPSRINRLGFASWGALGQNLVSRRELLPITAYQSLSDSEGYSTRSLFPMDMVTWSAFDPSAANTTGSAIQLNDGMSPCFIVWEPTTVAVNYNVSIFAEWRVIYNSDVQLASTQTPHESPPASFWQSIVGAASNVGGNLSALSAATGGIGSAINDARSIGNTLSGAAGNLMSAFGSMSLGLSRAGKGMGFLSLL